mmetsp:Transcript_40254/g.35785  ORF Transcript_40254/g.35785 Transcript_40254/m.35785 type:complete len:95 (+) Transcript_40254:2-286(+)
MNMVRSNNSVENSLGFLKEYRRLNVALTRPRRHLILICDTDTICRDEVFKGLVENFKVMGCIVKPKGLKEKFNKMDKLKGEAFKEYENVDNEGN